MKNKKRTIAAVLSIIMAFSMLPTSVFAVEPAEPATESVSVSAQGQEVEPTVEDVSEETAEALQETPEEIQPGETSLQTEAAESEETTEASEEEEDWEPAEEAQESAEGSYPSQDLEDHAAGVTVKVHAPQGALPEGTQLKVEEVRKEDVEDLANEATDNTVADFIAVDVSFCVRGRDNEIEPRQEVEVEFVLEEDVLPQAESYDVIHVAVDEKKGTETPEIIEEEKIIEEITSDGGTIIQKDFSVFIIAASGTSSSEDNDGIKAVEIYYFYLNEESANTVDGGIQRVQKGDALTEPAIPGGDGIFLGWYEKENGNFLEDPVEFVEITRDLISGKEHHVYPRFDAGEYCYVSFFDYDNQTVFRTDRVNSGTSYTTLAVEPQARVGKAFAGWKTDPDNAQTVTDPYTVNEDTKLYPSYYDAYLITFDLCDIDNDGTRATPVDSKIVPVGGSLAANDIPQAERTGYEFDGWYADPSYSTPYNFSSPVAGDVTVYAKWTPRTDTPYRLILWHQKVTDDKNATNKTYDFYRERTLTGTSGTNVSTPSSFANWPEEGYDINQEKTSQNVILRGDGTTVVNVYYDRKLITYEFKANNYRRARGADNPTHYLYLGIPVTTYRWGYYEAGTGPAPDREARYLYQGNSTMTGLYGQSLEQNGYTWPAGCWRYRYIDHYTVANDPVHATKNKIFETVFQNYENCDYNSPYYIVFEDDLEWRDFEVCYYKRSLNSNTGYTLADVVNGYGNSLTIQEKYQGFHTVGYIDDEHGELYDVIPEIFPADISESLPSGMEYKTAEVGQTINNLDLGDLGNDTVVYIFLERNEHDVIFEYKDGGNIKTYQNVKYGTALSGYDTEPEALVHSQNTYETFSGWYKDYDPSEGFISPLNFTDMTMPDANVTAYAGFELSEYTVTFDANGGAFTDQSTPYTITGVKHFSKLEEPEVVRAEYELAGWTAVNEEEAESAWMFDSSTVQGNITLKPNWLYTKKIQLLYCEGSDAYTDSDFFRDQAYVVLKSFDDTRLPMDDENSYFIGWSKTSGASEPEYYPGELFELRAEDVETVSGVENPVIRLYAVFGTKGEKKTTIRIHPAGNVTSYDDIEGATVSYGNEATAVSPGNTGNENNFIEIDVIANKGFDLNQINAVDSRWVLKGWTTDPASNTVQFAPDAVIAADTKEAPTNDLYAVWAVGEYYIEHSSGAETTSVPMPPKKAQTNQILEDNICRYTAKNYLYGGYYKKVNGNLVRITDTPGTSFVPELKQTYYLREVDVNYLKPQLYIVFSNYTRVVSGLYGLVNVDSAAIDGGDESDYDYRKCGLQVRDTKVTEFVDLNAGPVSATIEVNRRGDDGTLSYVTTLGRSNFGAFFDGDSKSFFIGYTQIPMSYIRSGAELEIKAYYVTRDGVLVTGAKSRKIRFESSDPVKFTDWTSTKTGLVSGESKAARVNADMTGDGEGGQSVSEAMGVRFVRNMKLVLPRDKVTYTVQKMDGEARLESQTVEPGQRTGEITYPKKDGFLFAGWFQDEELSVPADFTDVQTDMTVYAGYVPRKDITLSIARKAGKTGDVTFTATVSVKNINKFKEVGVFCDHDGETAEEALTKKTYVNVGSTKAPKYTYKFSGPVVVKGLAAQDIFGAAVYWVTKDGTRVTEEPARTCTYKSGAVKVRQ